MNNKKNENNAVDFQEYLEKQLKDGEFKKCYDEYGKQLEVAYQLLRLRKKARMTQSELAKKIGTTQSNVARMESGRQNFSLNLLQRIASAFRRSLRIDFVK